MVDQLYPRELGSLSVARYDSQGYGGGSLTRHHMGERQLRRWLSVLGRTVKGTYISTR
jgi:hypothetical protein